MADVSKNGTGAAKKGGTRFARNLAIWAGCAFLWCAIDRATKAFFDAAYHVGQVAVPDILGIVQLDLVRNRGVAWGAFAGNVPVIAIVTALMCVGIAAFAVYWARRCSALEMVGLGLLFAGGVGNLYDRAAQGYVVDFITPLFIDFPTFNVADIGVTCGIALLALCWIVQILKEGKSSSGTSSAKEE